jgi:hypothetical protein
VQRIGQKGCPGTSGFPTWLGVAERAAGPGPRELSYVIVPDLLRRRLVTMIGAYLDESTDEKAQTVFTLAAYMSMTEEWLYKFGPQWEYRLRKYNLEYFRASECENGSGQFAQFRSHPFPAPLALEDKLQLKQIKTDFVDLLISQPYLWGFGVNVLVKDLQAVVQANPLAREILSDQPYLIGYQVLLSRIGLDVKKFNDAQRPGFRRHMIAFVFDQPKKTRALAQYERFQIANPESSTWMASLDFADDRKLYQLQAADNLAYEIRKDCLNDLAGRQRPERKALARLKHRLAIVYRLDRRSLESLLRHNLEIQSISPHEVHSDDAKTQQETD